MKKIFALLFFISTIQANLYAQTKFEWGLKAGVQLSQFRGDNLVLSANTQASSAMPKGATTKTTPTIGYAIGAYFKTTETVFLQGEILLSAKGARIEPLAKTSTSATTTVQFTQLDLPLSIGYRHKVWEISGGPLISVQVFDNGELKKFLGQQTGREPSYQVFVPYTFGYQIGGGVHFGKMSVSLRRLASIMPVTSQSIAYTDPTADPQLRQGKFEQRSGVWQLSLGLRLN